MPWRLSALFSSSDMCRIIESPYCLRRLSRIPAHDSSSCLRHRDHSGHRGNTHAAPPAGCARRREVAEFAFQKQRAKNGSDFLPLHLQRIVVISCALRSDEGFGLVPGRAENAAKARSSSVSSTASKS
jgi:hypothetical protein